MLLRTEKKTDILELVDTLERHIKVVDSSTKLVQSLPDNQYKRAKEAHKIYKEALSVFENTVNSNEYLCMWLSYPVIQYVDYEDISSYEMSQCVLYHKLKHKEIKLYSNYKLYERTITIYDLLMSGI